MATKSDKQLVSIDVKYERAAVYVQPFFDQRKRVFVVGGKEYAAIRREDGVKKEAYYESIVGPNRTPDPKTGIIPETPMILSDRESIPVRHAEIFSGEEGDMLLQIAMDCGYVAKTQEAAAGLATARLYIRDDAAEARKTGKLASQVFEALGKLKDLTMPEKRDLAWALRKPVNTMSDTVLEGVINSMAMKQPDLLLATLDNRNFKLVAFLQQCVAHGLIVQQSGTYRFGGEVIGMDEAATVAFLDQKKNRAVKDQLVMELQKRQSGQVGTPTAQLRRLDASTVEDADELPFEDELTSTGEENTATA